MSDILIEVESGKSKRLKTANKLCKDDIVVTGTGGSGGDSDKPLEYANSVNFKGVVFPEGYEINLHLPNATNYGSMFYSAKGVRKITISGNDNNKVLNFNGFAVYAYDIEELDFSNLNLIVSDARNFCNSGKLRYIYGTFDFTNLTDNRLLLGSALEEIRIKEETLSISMGFSSPNLSADSIQSIIDGLADLTDGTAQTISWHTSVLEKLTDEQYETIFNKNWVAQ